MTPNSKIIEIAALANKLENIDSPDKAELDSYSHELGSLLASDKYAGGLFMIAKSLLSGNRCSVASDDPERFNRTFSLAQDIGATVKESSTRNDPLIGDAIPSTRSLVLYPPANPVRANNG
jgi:hypothetical protein